LQWFAVHRRPLPWRENRDPYRVWVAEVMLQQTRVDTAVPYYRRFLERFPTVEALAGASETEVLKAWEGLGYYSRARNLQRAAREVVARYGGKLPQEADALAALPGIGPYTAGAIAALAYNQPVAAVDGNVLRVMARVLGIDDDVTRRAVQRRIKAAVEAMIPPGRGGALAEALMELGALVCTPRAPRCPDCPWQEACAAYQTGQADVLPRRRARTRPRLVHGAVALIDWGGRVLVVRRPDEGLLAGLWEFPWAEAPAEADAGPALAQNVARRYGLLVRVERELAPVRHVFSHVEWRLRIYACRRVGEEGPPALGPGLTEHRWASPAELARLTFGRAHRRIGEHWLTVTTASQGGSPSLDRKGTEL